MTIPTFPTLIGQFFANRSPMMKTIKQEAISGKETRLQLWTYPRWKYMVSYDYMGASGANTDMETMAAFFNEVAGSALPFHFHDVFDNTATAQSLGTGDGSTTQFNFVRKMTGAAGNFTEPTQDVQSISSVTVAGTPTAAYTLVTDPNWGLTYALNFNSAPTSGQAIAATFTYDWPCRFDEDTIDFEQFMYSFFSLGKLSFTTVKVI